MAKENLAYDLSLFEPREPRPKKMLRVVKSRAHRVSPAVVVKDVMAGAFIVASLFAVMVLNVQLNEANNSLTQAQKRYNTAQSESVRLSVLEESRMSLKTVEDYAVNKLGMQKVQAGQISYINVGGGDKVTVCQPDTGVLSVLRRMLVDVEEYFQ